MPLRRDNGFDDFIEKIVANGGTCKWRASKTNDQKYHITIMYDGVVSRMIITYRETYYDTQYIDSEGFESNQTLEEILHDCLVY
jgi:6-phosphogluconate dehydrogenase